MAIDPDKLQIAENLYLKARFFNYQRKYLEFNTQKGIDNFDDILDKLTRYKAPEMNFYNIKSVGSAKNFILEIMVDILGEGLRNKIANFISITEWYEDYEKPFNGFINYSMLFGTPILEGFNIANINKSIGLVAAAHEFTHGLVLPKEGILFNDYFGNLHYEEFPSMMMEKIFAHKLEIFTYDNIAQKMVMIRNYANYCIAFDIMENIENKEKEENIGEYHEQLINFSNQIYYGYIISDVYATYLYEIYLDNPDKFIKIYRSLIKDEINLLDYFKKYDVSLERNEVKDVYIKSLKNE